MIEVKDAKETKAGTDFVFGNPSFADHEQITLLRQSYRIKSNYCHP